MVKVKRESEDMGGPPYERCCFCQKPTPYWCIQKDVALCPECAQTAHFEDVPTKEEWLKR